MNVKIWLKQANSMKLNLANVDLSSIHDTFRGPRCHPSCLTWIKILKISPYLEMKLAHSPPFHKRSLVKNTSVCLIAWFSRLVNNRDSNLWVYLKQHWIVLRKSSLGTAHIFCPPYAIMMDLLQKLKTVLILESRAFAIYSAVEEQGTLFGQIGK